jgi:hypothetical protein
VEVNIPQVELDLASYDFDDPETDENILWVTTEQREDPKKPAKKTSDRRRRFVRVRSKRSLLHTLYRMGNTHSDIDHQT